jgi:hypothetical protein
VDKTNPSSKYKINRIKKSFQKYKVKKLFLEEHNTVVRNPTVIEPNASTDELGRVPVHVGDERAADLVAED